MSNLSLNYNILDVNRKVYLKLLCFCRFKHLSEICSIYINFIVMKKTFLYILILINYACSNTKHEIGNKVIPLNQAFEQLEKISVEDIGRHIDYVPLETTDVSLIGDRAYIRILKDKLLVASREQPVKMFDRKTGKFIRCVGKIGQGADEYLLQDGFPVFWTDDASGTIYVQTEGQRILRFDADGSPLEHINLPEGMSRLQGLSVIGNADDLYFYQKTLSKKNENKIFSYNIPTGKLQTEIANQDDTIPFEIIRTPIILGGYGNTPVSTCCLILYLKNDNVVFDYSKEPCLWTFGDQVYLKENFNDTIYCVSDQSLEPRYVFDLGDRHWPYEERFHPEGNEDKIGFNYVLEGEKVLFFVFQTNYYEINYKGLGKDETYWGIYDKRNGRVKVMAKGKISDPANGLFVKSFQTATAEGELAGLLDIAEVKEWIKENPFKENNQVRQLLSDLPDESNPVAVIIE